MWYSRLQYVCTLSILNACQEWVHIYEILWRRNILFHFNFMHKMLNMNHSTMYHSSGQFKNNYNKAWMGCRKGNLLLIFVCIFYASKIMFTRVVDTSSSDFPFLWTDTNSAITLNIHTHRAPQKLLDWMFRNWLIKNDFMLNILNFECKGIWFVIPDIFT